MGFPQRWDRLGTRKQSTAPGYRYPFTPYPTGWYVACDSSELKNGKILPLRLFGEDLIAYRSDVDESAHVLDAHCPHLGAHIGYGGKVRNGCVQCPFHAWCFDEHGDCVKIPYCDSIPKGAKLRPWTVLEKNSFVMIWYQGPAVDMKPFSVPTVTEVGDPNWAHFQLKWRNRVHLQEMAENAIDLGHFNVVHAFDEKPDLQKFRIKEQKFHVKVTSPRKLLWMSDLVRVKIGFFGLGIAHAQTEMHFLSLRIIITHTPIDEEHCEVRMNVRFRKTWNFLRNWILRAYLPFHIGNDYYSDIKIWERKVYQRQALLCKGDGQINAIRRWAKQFYGGGDPLEF